MKLKPLLILILFFYSGFVNGQGWTTGTTVTNWVYNLGAATSAAQYSSGVYSTIGPSESTATAPGFLPYPPSGVGRVLLATPVSPVTSNGQYTLNTSAASLTMPAAYSGAVNKFSTYDIASASQVASVAFTVSFNTAPTNGGFIFSIGNHGASGNLFTNSSAVHAANTEVFATLQWAFTPTAINFNFRESATTAGQYKLISSTAFVKGSTYNVELYCNNSTLPQNYTRAGSPTVNSIPEGKFHIWVNGVQLQYSANKNIANSNELSRGSILNSFLFQGNQSTSPTNNAAQLTVKNISISHAQAPFNSTPPSENAGLENWSVTGSTPVAWSPEHYKTAEKKSIKWTAQSGDKLIASDLAIPSAQVGSSTVSTAQIWVYSPEISNDTLVFQFLDEAGTKRREGRMLLNYKGWRDYHRSYRYDYNNGGESVAFNLSRCEIIYKSAQPGTRTVYLDGVKFIGDNKTRMPGPHMRLDFQHFKKPVAFSSSGNGLESWLNQPQLPLTTASGTEISGAQLVKAFYPRAVGAVSATDLQTAKTYVNNCGISRNTDNSIKGRGLTSIDNPDTLVLISKHCGILGRAFINSADQDAKDKLLLFTEYLIDQGLAEGGRNIIPNNDYTSPDFSKGFLEAMSVYPADLKAEVAKMLKWSFEFNKIYAEDPMPGQDLDYIYLKSATIFELAFADPSIDVTVRDLKYLSRFLEQNTEASQGARDGMKPDGKGFHHKVHHISYLYSWGTWVDRAYSLRGTDFRISQKAFDTMAYAFKATFLESSRGTLFSNSESGRTPFQPSMPITSTQFQKLVQVGGDLHNTVYDPSLAAVYNYVYNTNTYPVDKADLDGFHHYNYAQLGVFRKKNWVATMKGMTNEMWGTEIYVNQNRYGRYQSYGSLEVLYNGTLESSGYVRFGDGWDWNVMPGTTTVHLPFADLEAQRDRADEYQVGNFAGALSLEKNGIFGMDFVQMANGNYTSSNLTFRKSVFSFDSIMVCLGSNIKTSNSLGNVATNLFQAITASSNPAIYVNSLNPESNATLNSTISTANEALWMVNAQTTGYYIPQGNSSVTVIRGSQSTPAQQSTDGSLLKTANASKAFINHGSHPTGDKYHFVVVPGTTPQKMQTLASQIGQSEIYTVLKQTDTLHAVKYLPTQSTSYAFFLPQENVEVGYIKSISNQALVGIKESGDTLTVTVNNPNLNPVETPDTESYWKSSNSYVDLKLSGNWVVLENTSGAGIATESDELTASFTLIHGFSSTIKLLKASTLPVSLTSFVGQYKDRNVQLKWTTVQEKNTDQFRVLRSVNGAKFQDIATVKAAGNSGKALNYSHNDQSLPLSGNLYYLLETVDKDGTTHRSSPVEIKLLSTTESMKVFPNPVQDDLQVAFSAAGAAIAEVLIVNMRGQIIMRRSVYINAGNNQITLPCSSLAAGEYVLVVNAEEFKGRKLFIKK